MLLFGVTFGVVGVKPVPAILVAQATNAVLLPLVAVYLFFLLNDPVLMGENRNRLAANVALVVVVGVAFVLGASNALEMLGVMRRPC